MFFDRSGSRSHPLSDLASQDKHELLAHRRRRRLAALGLAVAMATPAVLSARASAEEATPAPDVPPAKAADAQAKPSDAQAKPADAVTPKEHYKLALQQYRSGDWIQARKNFEAARGYTPGLFEGDRPEVYLARMDKKEQGDVAGGTHHVDASSRTIGAGQEAPATQPATTGGGADNEAMKVLQDTAKTEDLRRQQNAARAQELVRQARAAQDRGDLDAARENYAEATRLDPNNAQAQAGLDEVLTAQGRNVRNSPLLQQQEAQVNERRQEIKYRFQTAINEATAAIDAGNFRDADLALQRAQLAAGADRTIFNPDELRGFDQQINNTRVRLDQARAHAQEEATRQQNVRAQDRINEERKQALAERQRTIADLRQTAQNLTAQARYREALGVVDQILVLDPSNEYAIGVRPMLEDKYQFQTQRNYMEQRSRQTTQQFNNAEEKMIPYDDILRYPTDWPDISATRDQTNAAEKGETPENRTAQATLERMLPELSFDSVPFKDVTEFLHDVSGANMVVNWSSLKAANIDENTPISLKLRNIRFSKALNLVLNTASGGATSKLAYSVDDGVISISTADELANHTVTKVYDIRDLIVDIPDFTDAPAFDLATLNNQSQMASAGGAGGGNMTYPASLSSGSGGLFGSSSGGYTGGYSGGGQSGNHEKPGATRQDRVDEIVKIVQDTVAPDSWRENGGNVGSIRELGGNLIITQTPDNQKSLVNLLEQLRETRAIQVTVETRFLTVQRNFLEDVGLDLNFIFNLNGSWSKNWSQIPVQAANSAFTQGPFTAVPGSIANGGQGGTQSAVGSPQGSTAGQNAPTSLTTAATFLDDFQVQLLLRATQASITSTIVQAPRITLYNGQRAYVLVAVQQTYVSNLTAAVGTGVSAFQPVPQVVESGVVLDVVATVSADRKYVTLTLRPELANVIDIKQFTFQQGTSVAAVGGGGTFGTTVNAAPSGTIELPELQITMVKTSVTVPDGGTLLLGGQTIAGETEKEAGVPVLSKIPFLKRLFTNRSMAKDEQVLLILVKPTILITREVEQKQFPLLSSKLGG